MIDYPKPAQAPAQAMTSPIVHKTMPNVMTEFWMNPYHDLANDVSSNLSGATLPLTAVIGPHCIRIRSALAAHETLKKFAVGMDERYVFTHICTRWGTDYTGWDEKINGRPLVIAHFDHNDEHYMAYCLTVIKSGNLIDPVFILKISGIVYFDSAGKHEPIEIFCEPYDPLRLRFDAAVGSVEIDICRLEEIDPTDPDFFWEQLIFTASVFADNSFLKNPFAEISNG